MADLRALLVACGTWPSPDVVKTLADQAGQITRAEIFMLLRLDIQDERWLSAMVAIRDAMRVVGSKTYVRCYRRETRDGEWQPVTIDLAKA